jgi:hypothetical protein
MSFTLDTIKTEPDKSPPRIIVYSPEGVGKTTMAKFAPKPIFISTEEGKGRLTYSSWSVKTFSDVIQCIATLLREKHDFQTVVIDTISRFEQIVHADIRENNKSVKGGDVFANYGKGYKMVPPYFEKLIRGLNALRAKGMMVLVLGHAEIKRFEAPGTDAYDRYFLNLHQTARDMMFQWCDAMLFANFKVYTKTEEVGFNQTRTHGIGGEKRALYTEERPTQLAKNRFELPYELPFEKPFNWAGLLEMAGKSPPWGEVPVPEKPEQPQEGEQQETTNDSEE